MAGLPGCRPERGRVGNPQETSTAFYLLKPIKASSYRLDISRLAMAFRFAYCDRLMGRIASLSSLLSDPERLSGGDACVGVGVGLYVGKCKKLGQETFSSKGFGLLRDHCAIPLLIMAACAKARAWFGEGDARQLLSERKCKRCRHPSVKITLV